MNVLSFLGEVLGQIWSFISNTVNATVIALGFLSSAIRIPLSMVGFMPSFIGSCIVVVVALGVVKLILGWSGE